MVDADRSGADSSPESSVSDVQTDAEEAAAQAESRARQARARAEQLRRRADDVFGVAAEDIDGGAETVDVDPTVPSRVRAWRLRARGLRPPGWKTLGIGAAILVIVASLAASGYLIRQHMLLERRERYAVEYAAAARHGIEMMMSIDPVHIRDNVETLINNTTGDLQSQLRVTSTMLVQDAQQAKVTTKATVQDVAVASMSADSAVVLVVAQSDTTNPDNTKRPPVFWRISVNLARDKGRPLMSRVDFVQ